MTYDRKNDPMLRDAEGPDWMFGTREEVKIGLSESVRRATLLEVAELAMRRSEMAFEHLDDNAAEHFAVFAQELERMARE